MKKGHAILGVLVSFLSGCSSERLSPPSGGHGTVTSNLLTADGLGPDKLMADRSTITRLTNDRLAPIDVPMSADGMEVLSFVISCALPFDEEYDTTVNGELLQFLGEHGLAPAWKTRALTESEKRWVTACVLARVNADDLFLPISMRGSHPALTVDPDELEAWHLEEGAFYGNMFVPGDRAMELVACRGRDKAADAGGELPFRRCAEPTGGEKGLTACGFVFAGNCVTFSQQHQEAHACSAFVNGHYEACHTVAGQGTWPIGSKRDEVITVFVLE
jgi:hypothetical protein